MMSMPLCYLSISFILTIFMISFVLMWIFSYDDLTYLQAQTRHGENMNKAVDFLVKELPSIRDPYSLALVTYALHLAENPSRNAAFDMLQTKANNSSTVK